METEAAAYEDRTRRSSSARRLLLLTRFRVSSLTKILFSIRRSCPALIITPGPELQARGGARLLCRSRVPLRRASIILNYAPIKRTQKYTKIYFVLLCAEGGGQR